MSQIEQVDQDLSERIRERAYEIWVANGYRDGEADQHWLAAEHEIEVVTTEPQPTETTDEVVMKLWKLKRSPPMIKLQKLVRNRRI